MLRGVRLLLRRAPCTSSLLLRAPGVSPAPALLIATRHLAKGKKGKGKDKGKAAAAAVEDDDNDDVVGSKLDEAELKEKMAKPLEQLQREFGAMQTGRAQPSLLDAISVHVGEDAGGSVPLPNVAKVLAQGPQALSVTCYDAAHVNAAVAAIEKAPLDLRAEQQGKVIKVSVPRATKDSREQLAKHAKSLAEAARTAVRGVRQRGMKTAKSESSKEEVRRSEKKVEDATKAVVALIDEAVKVKEKEILTV